ncbi:phage distal tail protein [Paenibacillus sp. FSL R7-0128]|uniref:phage distal tail protein n=1 Tax=Paenibacillus sp. FSL R7-0128 TaxID=2954529 RepID=UPI0030FC302B
MFAGAFNLTPFNRLSSFEAYFVVQIESLTEAAARLSVDAAMAVIAESATEFNTSMVREIPRAAIIESTTEMITAMVRELLGAVTFESSTETIAELTKTHVDLIRFNGNFSPGDRLIIDTRKQTVTLNGVNVLHLFDGDFFELAFGPNAIRYTDGEAARNILTRITHRDRYLY